MQVEKSKELFEKALKLMPGGVSSATRGPALGTLPGVHPIFMTKAKGSRLYDVDGNEYIDYAGAFGPVILGYGHPKVLQAVKEQLERGEIFGMCHELELRLAEKLVKAVPCADLVSFSNTGSEATSLAIRIARTFTGKEKIVKFEGHYHGWHDWCMVDSTHAVVGAIGPSVLKLSDLSSPTSLSSAGIPRSVLLDTIVIPWNESEVFEKVISRRRDEIAAVICEPTGPGGVVLPNEGYLQSVRRITKENEVLLIFDEVKTGFRLALGGAQEYYGVTPDLATFAKAMGNGFPIAAVTGDQEIMDYSVNRMWYAGTYNANPVSVAASLATLTELENRREELYPQLFEMGRRLMKGIEDAIQDTGVQATVQGPGPQIWVIFSSLKRIKNARDLLSIMNHPHKEHEEQFRIGLIKRGIFIVRHPWYISAAHTREDIDRTIEASEESLKEARNST